MLRAAVLIGTLIPIVLLWVIHAILAAVPLTVRVTTKPHTAVSSCLPRRLKLRSIPDHFVEQPHVAPSPHGQQGWLAHMHSGHVGAQKASLSKYTGSPHVFSVCIACPYF